MKHGFGLERIGLLATRQPKIAAAMVLLVLAVCALLVPSLKFDRDINRALLSKSDASQAYRAFLQTGAGETKDLIVLVEKNTPFLIDDYENMRNLALELEFADGVESVLSPFSMRFAQNHPDFPQQPVFPSRLDATEISSRLAAFGESPQLQRSLISRSQTSALLIISHTALQSAAEETSFLNNIQTMAVRFIGGGLQFEITGEQVIAATIANGLKADLLWLNIVGALFVLVLATLLFRSVTTALAAALPALGGVLVCLALFVVLDYPITVISNVLPILVLVLGIADSLHLVMHFRQQSADKPLTARITRTISEIGPACALAALTTAIAFFAIALSDNDQLFEFAIAGSLAVILSFFMVIIGFALLAPFVAPARESKDKSGNLERLTRNISHQTALRPRTIIVASTALFALALWGFSKAQPWFEYEGNLPSTSSLAQTNQRVVQEFGGFYRLWVELDISGTNNLATPQGWSRLQKLSSGLKEAAPDYQVFSLATLADWLGEPENLPDADALEQLPTAVRDQLVSADKTTARVLVLVPEPMANSQTRAAHDAITEAANINGASRVFGLPQIIRHESVSIVQQLGVGLLLACLVAVVLIAFAFRWPKLSLVLIIPNVLPLALTAASLHILNNGYITPTAVLALTIALGIAVDDSIHFVNRYRLERQQGTDIETALGNATHHAGGVMIFTTVLLSAGLAITAVSAFAPVQLFGQMLILTFIIALFADLLLLPALLRLKWFER